MRILEAISIVACVNLVFIQLVQSYSYNFTNGTNSTTTPRIYPTLLTASSVSRPAVFNQSNGICLIFRGPQKPFYVESRVPLNGVPREPLTLGGQYSYLPQWVPGNGSLVQNGGDWATTIFNSNTSFYTTNSATDRDRCCASIGSCYVYGPDVRLFYFPVSTGSTWCLNYSRTLTGKDPRSGFDLRRRTEDWQDGDTVVLDGYTYTYPSVYVDFGTLSASDSCGTLGGTYSTKLAFSPGELSTGEFRGETIGPFNPKDMPCPNFDAWGKAGFYGYQPRLNSTYLPIIRAPSRLFQIDPAWSKCTILYGGRRDPPKALAKASALDPAVTAGNPDPLKTPAVPAQGPSAQPAKTTNVPLEMTRPSNYPVDSAPLPVLDPSSGAVDEQGSKQQNPGDPPTKNIPPGSVGSNAGGSKDGGSADGGQGNTGQSDQQNYPQQPNGAPAAGSQQQSNQQNNPQQPNGAPAAGSQQQSNQQNNPQQPNGAPAAGSEQQSNKQNNPQQPNGAPAAGSQQQSNQQNNPQQPNGAPAAGSQQQSNQQSSQQQPNGAPSAAGQQPKVDSAGQGPFSSGVKPYDEPPTNQDSGDQAHQQPPLGPLSQGAYGDSSQPGFSSQQNQNAKPALVVEGQTLTNDGPPVTISGTPIVYSGGTIRVGTNEPVSIINQQPQQTQPQQNQQKAPPTPLIINGLTFSPLPQPPTPSNIILIANQPATLNALGNLEIAGQTLRSGSPAIAISGTPLSLGSSFLVYGSKTIPFPPTTPFATIANNIITSLPAPNSLFIINGQTLTPNGPAVTISGTAISLAPSALIIGTQTIALGATQPLITSPPQSVFTIGGKTFTANPTGFVIAPGTTLTPGGAAITISGTVISLASSGDSLRIGTSIVPLLGPASSSVFTLGSQTFTAYPSGFVIAGKTLAPGGVVTVDGTRVALGTDGNLVIGSKTIPLQGGVTTESGGLGPLGSFIMEGLKGAGGAALTSTMRGGGNGNGSVVLFTGDAERRGIRLGMRVWIGGLMAWCWVGGMGIR